MERCFLVEQEQDNILYENRNYAANVLAVDSTFFHFFAYPVYEGKLIYGRPMRQLLLVNLRNVFLAKKILSGRCWNMGSKVSLCMV